MTDNIRSGFHVTRIISFRTTNCYKKSEIEDEAINGSHFLKPVFDLLNASWLVFYVYCSYPTHL